MRKYRPQEQWQALVDQQRDSGLSAMQFCKQEDIGYASFCSWRKRLTEEPAANSAGSGEAGFLDLSSLSICDKRSRDKRRLGNKVRLSLSRPTQFSCAEITCR